MSHAVAAWAAGLACWFIRDGRPANRPLRWHGQHGSIPDEHAAEIYEQVKTMNPSMRLRIADAKILRLVDEFLVVTARSKPEQ